MKIYCIAKKKSGKMLIDTHGRIQAYNNKKIFKEAISPWIEKMVILNAKEVKE